MDKIAKALKRLSDKEKNLIKSILLKIKSSNYNSLQIKKLSGYDNIFRVRKGKLRVIFKKDNNDIDILAIEQRNDKTYNLK